ncbi:MAG TPA: hypothetical protein VKV15_05415 [Bryobacteraceae bacterium]|nr:hypothetical protein [Bryobacteraceae bacterium]
MSAQKEMSDRREFWKQAGALAAAPLAQAGLSSQTTPSVEPELKMEWV